MRRKTTTKQLQQAIKNNLLKLIRAEKYSKSTRRTMETKNAVIFSIRILALNVVGCTE